MRALAWAVIVLGVALVADGVFSIEHGWFAAAGAFAIVAGAATLLGDLERETREESEPVDYGPLGTPHPGYDRDPDGHPRLKPDREA